MKGDLLSRLRGIKVIQGGMGLGVSSYKLANAVSREGQLGVVSCAGIERINTRKLQDGNTEIRDAMLEFPDKEFAKKTIDKYFIPAGERTSPYKEVRFPVIRSDEEKNLTINSELEKLLVLSSFAEVKLAKKGHSNPVGVNLLYEIEWPMVPLLYGAILADADAFLIGAGLPAPIPAVLDSLSNNEEATMKAKVRDGIEYKFKFNPKSIIDYDIKLNRPPLMAIVNGHLAANGIKNADAYIVEGVFGPGPLEAEAGGHVPAPRKDNRIIEKINEHGEPIFGKKDEFNLGAFQSFLESNAKARDKEVQPWWAAGNFSNKLTQALNSGAQGVQSGTPFASCIESGIPYEVKEKGIKDIVNDDVKVYTNPLASPSGFPFNVKSVEGSLSDSKVYESRKRVCKVGHLVKVVEREGKIITRCPSEPLKHYERKGGDIKDTKNKICLCENLLSAVGLSNPNEPAIYTSGKNLEVIKDLAGPQGKIYTAKDVIEHILKS